MCILQKKMGLSVYVADRTPSGVLQLHHESGRPEFNFRDGHGQPRCYKLVAVLVDSVETSAGDRDEMCDRTLAAGANDLTAVTGDLKIPVE